MIVLEVVGWAGAVALLLAYGLLSGGRAAPTSRAYRGLNLAGAVGLAVNGAAHAAWPSVALNLLWLAIGLFALRRRPATAVPTDGSPAPHRP